SSVRYFPVMSSVLAGAFKTAGAEIDPLTYIWEQMDEGTSSETGANSAAKDTKAAGPIFRSWKPSSSSVRYFPVMSSVLAGAFKTAGAEIDPLTYIWEQ
ncbi:hypothetical protein, partial [Chryseobacterium sp. CH1]|uniref:hypothetical protein n=1 Tax=Chryseobacterium sp. CH1 TaxID=713551 RepID=UPI0010273B95